MNTQIKELFNIVVLCKEVRESKQEGKQFLITSTNLWINVSNKIVLKKGMTYSVSGTITTYQEKPQFGGFFVNECPVKEIDFEKNGNTPF